MGCLKTSLFVIVALAFGGSHAKVTGVGETSGVIEGCVIPCKLGAYFQHPSDCSKFIQCAPAGPAVMSCPEGLIWNQHILTCDFPRSVSCETGKYLTPDGKPCNELPTEVPPTQPPTEESSGEGSSSEESSEEEGSSVEECEFKCPKAAGIFAHPRDCRRYFTCLLRKPKEHKCPLGLHFNNKLKVCTTADLAKCKADPDAEC
ncbi:peritrophin-1-like [Macrobrachium rosenbergii]|uniref:peritrophin-1-like n=1 Tax=Macrobrachium rosenbergii TaxID=79674 RepID=UPI0034D63C51